MNPNITVVRKADQTKETIGHMTAVNETGANMTLCTLERPWLNNQQGVSCIPSGTYSWSKVAPSHIPYPHILLSGMPDREGVCIHVGNYVTNSEGCILVGRDHKDINGDGVIDLTDSTAAFHELMSFMPESGLIKIE